MQYKIWMSILAALLIIGASAQAQDIKNWGLSSYFNTNHELSFATKTELQLIRSMLNETRYDAALERLPTLLQSHPDLPLLYLLLGEAHLGKADADQALDAFQMAEVKAGTQSEDVLPVVDARIGQSQAYAMKEEYALALAVLDEISIDALPAGLKERLYDHQALLYQFQGAFLHMYHSLENAILLGNNSTPARQHMSQFREEFARAKYEQGQNFVRAGAYGQAVRSLRDVNELVPDNSIYVNALNQANQQFMVEVNQRIRTMIPAIIPILKEIKWYMANADYEKAYQHYLRLLQDDDINYFITNGYTNYLPKNMHEKMQEIALVLNQEGYDPGIVF